MKISQFRRFQPEDYPDFPKNLEKFFITLNTALEQLFSAVGGGLTLAENSNGEIIRTDVEHNVTYELQVQNVRGAPVSAQGFVPGYNTTQAIAFPRDGTMTVKFTFAAPPGKKVPAVIQVFGE